GAALLGRLTPGHALEPRLEERARGAGDGGQPEEAASVEPSTRTVEHQARDPLVHRAPPVGAGRSSPRRIQGEPLIESNSTGRGAPGHGRGAGASPPPGGRPGLPATGDE